MDFLNHREGVWYSLRFLGIILRVLRLEVSVWISLTTGKGVRFSLRFLGIILRVLKLEVSVWIS
jgi:hypothetical protein